MSDKKGSLSNYMTGTPYPTPEKRALPEMVKAKKPYKAFTDFMSGEKRERFKLIDADGTISFYSYGHLMEGQLKNNILTLTMTTRVFVISGKNLVPIIDALNNRKVKALHAFTSDIYAAITDQRATVIESIEESND